MYVVVWYPLILVDILLIVEQPDNIGVLAYQVTFKEPFARIFLPEHRVIVRRRTDNWPVYVHFFRWKLSFSQF